MGVSGTVDQSTYSMNFFLINRPIIFSFGTKIWTDTSTRDCNMPWDCSIAKMRFWSRKSTLKFYPMFPKMPKTKLSFSCQSWSSPDIHSSSRIFPIPKKSSTWSNTISATSSPKPRTTTRKTWRTSSSKISSLLFWFWVSRKTWKIAVRFSTSSTNAAIPSKSQRFSSFVWLTTTNVLLS